MTSTARNLPKIEELPRPVEAPGLNGSSAASAKAAAGNQAVEVWTIGRLLATPPDPDDTLLGDRFLCRTGSMLFVGPSGIGKSSASMCQDVSWACGREAFGIVAARPLRILCIQAENDAGDLHEMAAGVVSALELTEYEERQVEENFQIVRHQSSVGMDFIVWLTGQIEKQKPDLIRLDPLLAYLGADPTDTKAVAAFCRNGLNPLIELHKCGLILCHHTPKTINRDTSNWRPSDWSYSGGGAADLTNWARAILVVDPTQDPGTFRFIAAKRGRRIGWLDANGAPTQERFYSHAKEHGVIAWSETPRDLAEELQPSRGKTGTVTEAQFLELLPDPDMSNLDACLITTKELEFRVREKKLRKEGLAGLRDHLEREGKIFVQREAGRARAIRIGRPEIGHLLAQQKTTLPMVPDASPRFPGNRNDDGSHASHASLPP